MMDVFGLMKALGRKKVSRACNVQTGTIAQWVYNSAIPQHHMDTVRRLAAEGGVRIEDYERNGNGK